ncbi:hypothetical protein Goklo_021161 [Gossypium klotzschianum]|uniref:DUF4283 domain-containing protein n=1 Tax=Gossypium klotzschianum TaxID=34286 RepID=A0A7J8UUA6_9ROSI|nr:hypothetical protein [Gossypium klotzschianum]
MCHRLLEREDPLFKVDIDRVVDEAEDPLQVPLFNADFWVQLHDLPHGLMSKVMITQFGQIILGKNEIPMAWDISLKTVGKRAFSRISVLLRKEGIDIEGYLHQAYLEGNLGRLMSRPDTELIDCEGDDSPIHVVDGKKRARVINLGLLGSTMNDLSGKGNEQAKAHTWLD